MNKLTVLLTSILLFVVFMGFVPVSAQDGDDVNRAYEGLVWAPDGLTVGGCATMGGSVATDVPANFSLGTDPLERRIALMVALMADFGLSAEQAAGVVGNFMWESGGHHLPPDINEHTDVSGPPEFNGGYGWAQWTGVRQEHFINFAIENGYMASDQVNATDAANYAYLKYELTTGYTETIDALRTMTTPEDAAVSFEATFERAATPDVVERGGNARQVYEEYLANGGVVTSTCVATGSATIVGDYAFPLITTKSGIGNPGMFSDGTASRGGHPYIAYDILVAPGTPVAAFLSGTVTRISQDRCPGRLIGIFNSESNLTISYLHLDFNNHVGLGEEVVVGQQIGLVGSAANGCGTPHLHIDAAAGDSRPSCSRLNCPAANQAFFRDIGPELYQTYQALPE